MSQQPKEVLNSEEKKTPNSCTPTPIAMYNSAEVCLTSPICANKLKRCLWKHLRHVPVEERKAALYAEIELRGPLFERCLKDALGYVRRGVKTYAVSFCIEADCHEVLEKAVNYVKERMETIWSDVACNSNVCTCRVEWDGELLTIETCSKRDIRLVVELLTKAYAQYGGKTIRLVKCKVCRLIQPLLGNGA
jgi:hypothetical protein